MDSRSSALKVTFKFWKYFNYLNKMWGKCGNVVLRLFCLIGFKLPYYHLKIFDLILNFNNFLVLLRERERELTFDVLPYFKIRMQYMYRTRSKKVGECRVVNFKFSYVHLIIWLFRGGGLYPGTSHNFIESNKC